MPLPASVAELVERFEANRTSYQSAIYNEAQTRQEFINPLFTALGWDVDNTQGFAEAYKDVIHEDAIKIGGVTKAPDYSFRIGGTRKFFLEAKKPAVVLKFEKSAAFQLRRYAWSAKLPLSILTNFAEFAVYDCRIGPEKEDQPSKARLFHYTYKDYAEKWDEIAGIFSKTAILKGSFDKFAESSKGKRGTAEVDAAFLAQIEAWRDLLARNLALRNPDLSQRDLNFAVQRTIDRIVFLRICEDRGMESYGALQALLNGTNCYARLCELFHAADERYNSGLFHFSADKARPEEPDGLTLRLGIDDKTLKDILRGLYYPDSPYVFSVIPADILGQAYEQFLGKIIRLTTGHRAVIEDKPEVKKAGGVYYTPTYIVDYIVQNTLGKLLDGKSPKEAAKLRILDPACGSGSFLIGAFQYLLDWHRDWYVADGPTKHKKEVYEGPGGLWLLTSATRKTILRNSIYGVDIDAQAVEVTKLSLLLKVLEGESAETLNSNLKLFKERALPDLGDNIKCGNSLIGPDFYDLSQAAALGNDELLRINPFDWQAEFKEIMQGGGFDAVIGNPPYIRIQAMKEWAPFEVEYYKKAYASATKGNYDIYVVFVEKGLGLLNEDGRLGFILPHKFFNSQYGQPIRKIISDGKHLSDVVHFGDQQIFANATTYTTLLFLDKRVSETCQIVRVNVLAEWRNNAAGIKGTLSNSSLSSNEWNFTIGAGAELFKRLQSFPVKLGQISKIFVGLQTSADTVFLFKRGNALEKTSGYSYYSNALDKFVDVEDGLLKPVVRSGNIGRYWAKPTAKVIFPYKSIKNKFCLLPEQDMATEFPITWSYLNSNKTLLAGREHGKFMPTGWYQLYPKNLDVWEQPKIMVPYMVTRLSAYFDNASLYFVNVTTGGFGITVEEKFGSAQFVTGLLNSKLLDWFFRLVTTNFNSGYFAANKQYLTQLPIRTINFDDTSDKAKHDKMVELVEKMLKLHKELPGKMGQEKTVMERQIAATDTQIDRLVYDLYGLTEEEIKIVEEAA